MLVLEDNLVNLKIAKENAGSMNGKITLKFEHFQNYYMKKKPTYQDLEKEIEKLKGYNQFLNRENTALKAEKEKVADIEYRGAGSGYPDDELQNEKYLLNVLMKNIPSRIYFKNRESQFVKINSRLAKRHGFNTIEEVLGKTDFDFFTKENAQAAFDDEQEIMKTGKPLIEYEEKEIWTNGEIAWASITKVPLFNENNKIIGIFGITKDITEKLRSEHALKESEQKLRELNATKDKFFSIIAHDLRSPFNTMLGFAKLLVDKFDSFDIKKQKKFLGILTMDIENTHKLLENLLLWAQTQRGTIDFDPGKENLYLLTRETLGLLRQSAADKAIFLINQIPEDIYVHADRNMLLTILRNLISNAIKFTRKEGTVKIGVKTRHGVSLHQETDNELVELYVEDNGLGISKEKQEHLFEISENISTKGTENEAGTGLGLILCKEFVEKHGGKIWVESDVGKGSKFIFTL